MVSQAIYGYRPKGGAPQGTCSKTLPDAQHVLHAQAHARNANPAAKAERDGLAALLDQIDDIGVKAHRRHSHNDKELGKRLEWRRDGCRQRKHSSNYTCKNKEQHKEREDLFEREGAARICARLFCLMHLPEGEHKRDGDDGERARKLDHRGALQHVGTRMHAVPGACRRRHRRGVVDSRARKQAKALVREAQHAAERGENQRRDNVEQEDDRDGLGDLFVIRIDNRSRCGNSRTAANGGAHAHKRRDLRGNAHDTEQMR